MIVVALSMAACIERCPTKDGMDAGSAVFKLAD